jgi:integrase/recombinase XerD
VSASATTLESWVNSFLTDLKQANYSPHTLRAYAADLHQMAAFYAGPLEAIRVEDLRAFLETFAHLKPATRARKQAALNSFFTWAYRQELIPANPMARIDPVRREEPAIRALTRAEIEQVLAVIPRRQRRDRLLFRLLFETGLRVGEALKLYLEDLDLTEDDEHVHVVGKGRRRRTVLLDDRKLVRELRAYLKQTGYKHGPLFRAHKNGRDGPLRYQSVQ